MTEYEKAVRYDSDLHSAAMDVIAMVDESSPGKELIYWIRFKAKEYNVSIKDLRAVVLEIAEW